MVVVGAELGVDVAVGEKGEGKEVESCHEFVFNPVGCGNLKTNLIHIIILTLEPMQHLDSVQAHLNPVDL